MARTRGMTMGTAGENDDIPLRDSGDDAARTEDDLRSAVSEFLKLRDKIETSSFECSGTLFCKNCEYKMLCGGVSV